MISQVGRFDRKLVLFSREGVRILGTQKDPDIDWLHLATSEWPTVTVGSRFWHQKNRLSQLSRRSLSKDLLSTEAGNVQLVQL